MSLPWNDYEDKFINSSVQNIRQGKSIYSQVKKLHDGPLRYRTWESIRSKINRSRKEVT